MTKDTGSFGKKQDSWPHGCGDGLNNEFNFEAFGDVSAVRT